MNPNQALTNHPSMLSPEQLRQLIEQQQLAALQQVFQTNDLQGMGAWTGAASQQRMIDWAELEQQAVLEELARRTLLYMQANGM